VRLSTRASTGASIETTGGRGALFRPRRYGSRPVAKDARPLWRKGRKLGKPLPMPLYRLPPAPDTRHVVLVVADGEQRPPSNPCGPWSPFPVADGTPGRT